MEFTAAQRATILETQRANILKKLQSGKTLTAREQAILDGDSENYVHTQEALASALGVDRMTISKLIRKYAKDPRLPGKRRGAESDGRYNVAAWRHFLASIGVKGKGRPERGDQTDQDTEAYWKRSNQKLQFERGVFEFEIQKKKHVELSEICGAVGQMLAGFRTAINMLPGSAARWLVGLKDFHAIKEKLQSEVDAVLQSLGRCKYFFDLAPVIVDEMFSDRPQEYRDDVLKGVSAVFLEIGRTSLGELMPADFRETSPGEIPISPGPAPTGPDVPAGGDKFVPQGGQLLSPSSTSRKSQEK